MGTAVSSIEVHCVRMVGQKYEKLPTVGKQYLVGEQGKPQNSRRWKARPEVTKHG
jgi:hypothetical protein